MKNRHGFMFVLGIAALAFGITVLGCDNGTTDTTGDTVSPGETVNQPGTVSNTGGGTLTFTHYRKWASGETEYDPLAGAGLGNVTVNTDGTFTLTLGTPNGSVLETVPQGEINASPFDTKFFGIADFTTTDGSTSGKMLSLKKGVQQVAYLYADKDATLSGGFITDSVKVSKGWNMLIQDNSAQRVFAGPVDGFTWVIEDY
ncbi:MAG: hypothetical protein LBP69_02045 [Treponema sp.]|nr:hypothetical protein [Treponema sp.]